ncbi:MULTISPECIES: hypothetical protein [unclassified Streptomyces]|uniref:hypothetical protein n=1 Tax=unclassified Streptomyces TaxID=2593676 RepID=UPI00093D503C|nr:hypothetical protein [Streptomyces sp. CB01883]OKJ80702.1 hypothetical protein AMK32_23260 [Streptomyces sp. CB01883]
MYLIVVSLAVLAAFKATWDEFSHAMFAGVVVCFAIGACAVIKMSAMSAEAQKTGRPMNAGDEGGYGCLFWIAWKVGGAAVLLMLCASCSRWF